MERTDAADGFVTLLQESGYSARRFNILTDDFHSTYDLVFANCVFLHFSPQELKKVLNKIQTCLKDKGILSFSLKKGEGEEWTTVKIGQPRYFCYWNLDAIQQLLESTGFVIVTSAEDDQFLRIIARTKK